MKTMIYFFLSLSSLSFFLSLFTKKLEEFIFSFLFLSLNMNNYYICFIIDFFSSFFLFTVSLITLSILMYSKEYMSEEIYNKRFFMILILFVLSMIFLIFSANLLTAMIGWDGLGFSSLLLIIYFHSPSSFKAGMIAFLCNRVGDAFLIISTCLLFFFPEAIFKGEYLISIFIVLTAITKSAQLPFSHWLPAAMAAPTPVSSLVHSSTLVTAGIYLLFRFFPVWEKNYNLTMSLSVLSLCTLVMASMCALCEMDMKKIIAFSTLSQLGMMMYSLSIKLTYMTYFHLITHAFTKALLFMAAGYTIHYSNNNQDIRKIGTYSSSIYSIFLFSSFSLCGFPFLSGFYSKDLIIENILSMNFSFKELFFMMSIFSTLIYMFRLLKLIMESSLAYSKNDYNTKMIYPMLILMVMSSVSGSLLSWMEIHFFSSSLLEKILCLFLILLLPIVTWMLPSYKSTFISQIWFILSIYEFFSVSFLYLFNFLCILEKPGFMTKMHASFTSISSINLNWSLSLMKLIELFIFFFLLISILFNSTVNNSLPLFWL